MENRVDKAERLFREGYNCAQAVIAAYCDIYGMDEEVALKLSASFGAGMGRMREVCGAVSAMFMIAGLENGPSVPDAAKKKENYDLVAEMAQVFKKNNGTIICRELLGLDKPKESAKVDTKPQERTENYYKTRPCVDKVRECAQIIEDIILSKSKER